MIFGCISKCCECIFSCKKRTMQAEPQRDRSITAPEHSPLSRRFGTVQIPSRGSIMKHPPDEDIEVNGPRPMILRMHSIMQADERRQHLSGRDGAQTDITPPAWREDEQGIVDGIAEQKFSYFVRDLEDLMNERRRSCENYL